ncbi:hypothetical protein PG993_011367 [Apiospora rasikravindrae]|uniref:Uncharacterized protein n=1 Tax=Apiospora rasikravindrae TaxID=990691 RepID=A0ABR1SEB9_9PEZI
MELSTTAVDVSLYTTSEKILIATSSFSLTVSVVTELLLFYILHKGTVNTKLRLRSLLLTVLSANCLISFSAFVFVALVNHLPIADGTPDLAGLRWNLALELPANLREVLGAERSRWNFSLVASQWLCLLVFLLSAVLFTSAWFDLKTERIDDDDEAAAAGNDEKMKNQRRTCCPCKGKKSFGEKGAIYI